MVGKGARTQKKKALNDFLHALETAGASRSRSAVPAEQRSLTSWFLQVSSLSGGATCSGCSSWCFGPEA